MRHVAVRLVAVFCMVVLLGIVAVSLSTSAAPLEVGATRTPLGYGVNAVDEQGEPYVTQIVATALDSGRVITYRVKPSPTPDGATPIGRAPVPRYVWQHNAYMPMQRQSGYQLKVFVAAYFYTTEDTDPGVPTDHSVAANTLTSQLIGDLRDGSSWHGLGVPQLSFTVYNTITKVFGRAPHLANGDFDYTAFYNTYGLCSLIQQHLVDEVWVWGDSDTGMAESVVNGPTWSMTRGPLPDCGRTVTTYGFNYHRHVALALESYMHSIEYLFENYVPAGLRACDFGTVTRSFAIFPVPGECAGALALSDYYGFTARAWAGINGNVAECGWAHQAPNDPRNVMSGTQWLRSSFLETNTVETRCTSWVWGATGTTTAFNCYTFGCVQPPPNSDPYTVYTYHLPALEKYAIWWMRNFPGPDNNSHDRNGLSRDNWWVIKFR